MPKEEHASRHFYDVWMPDLSPSDTLVKQALAAANARDWSVFVRRFRTEMKLPAAARLLRLLAVLSQDADFSVGCYCADEARCHRSVLRSLLKEHGARLV